MSRFDSDYDYYDAGNQPYGFNTECSDCGEPFRKSPADVGTLCDTCCSLRDEHTTAYEIRMAKAQLKVKALKEIA